jgi:hypothetical protein
MGEDSGKQSEVLLEGEALFLFLNKGMDGPAHCFTNVPKWAKPATRSTRIWPPPAASSNPTILRARVAASPSPILSGDQ